MTANDDDDTDRDDNNNYEGSHSSSSYSSSDVDESLGDDGSSPLLSQRSVVVKDNDDAGSQVTFDTVDLTTPANFTCPICLNAPGAACRRWR